MKAFGGILAAIGGLLLAFAFYNYATTDVPQGKRGPNVVMHVGMAGVPLVIGLVLLSKKPSDD